MGCPDEASALTLFRVYWKYVVEGVENNCSSSPNNALKILQNNHPPSLKECAKKKIVLPVEPSTEKSKLPKKNTNHSTTDDLKLAKVTGAPGNIINVA